MTGAEKARVVSRAKAILPLFFDAKYLTKAPSSDLLINSSYSGPVCSAYAVALNHLDSADLLRLEILQGS